MKVRHSLVGHRTMEIVVVVLTLVVGLGALYGSALREGLPRVSGDIYDARIFIAVLEHWYAVLTGGGTPLSPPYFFPYPYTLSYGDGLLFGGVLYAVPRTLGFDPFVSYEIVNAVVAAIGFVATYVVARRMLGISVVLGLFAALLALVANSLAMRSIHAQLLYAAFFPVGLLLVWPLFLALTDSGGRRARSIGTVVRAVATVAFFFVWAMTSFYSLYAFVLLSLVALLTAAIADPALRLRVWLAVRHPSLALIVLALGLAGSAVAIFGLYSQSGYGGHGVSAMKAGTVSIAELVNVGVGNWVWGGLMEPLRDRLKPPYTRDAYGLSPVLVVAFLASMIWIGRLCRLRLKARGHREGDVDAALFAYSMGIGALVLALFAVHIARFAPFQPLFVLLPGASAIRVPARFLLFIGPVVALVVAYALDLLADRGRWAMALVAVLVAFILAEQVHDDSALRLDRRQEQAFLDSVGQPPESCEVFYVFNPRFPKTGNDGQDRLYVHGVDAMLLASYYRLPTINGMATFTPPGWDVVGPFEPDYLDRVRAYAERHDILDGLCGLDLKERRWREGMAK
ncbi:hypothetical protein [Amorphus sp. 3PC139-8]|uniref:hypothetical protein n=1 Tax=Amorphus sp. 3PC139-8 TaxID=2735676 RepID=UPI00345DD809